MFVGCKTQSVREAVNLATVCELIVYKMWGPGRLTTLWTTTAYYKLALDSTETFIFLLLLYISVTNKRTPWPLVRKRTIPTERPPLVDEI
jgi:hypothetical protein